MSGYFEGPIDAGSGTAKFSWFDTPRPPVSASGTAAVRFSGFGPAHNVTGEYWGGATGAWLGLRCALVPNASAEEMMAWCLWSPATDRARARAA
eukprot:CAMPEP_0172176154 /NCGR_PEP_ID=MMETSP1050-20130122/14637_1 /TAXON_ID=233186 /ORGANISM="Cryptomonas curvata, Strain CCAP979/52" /LENGTH=93 /DNA_ID=CAMNT_0012848359 /DNA_START=355 /DNA_END=632 /DNA_ORIENTATION=+